GRYVGGRFGYANGPLDVALAVGQNVAVDTTSLTRKVQTVNLGASYDLGPVKLFGEISNVQNKFDTLLGNSHDSYKGYLLGASMPVGAGLIRASY
ncbi:porin, partial [Variovorax sp. KBW07]|uniref:porin n=1 Tax=Variovorax sp. KBW07 TaxID=2153358 RepID=UPI0021AA6B29